MQQFLSSSRSCEKELELLAASIYRSTTPSCLDITLAWRGVDLVSRAASQIKSSSDHHGRCHAFSITIVRDAANSWTET